MDRTIPWRCKVCGANGEVTDFPDVENRMERHRLLFNRTMEQHPDHGLISLFWDFPEWWHDGNKENR